MLRLGIDVGSTYTNYCVLSCGNKMEDCFAEKTPIRQKEYFERRLTELKREKGDLASVSCGYGKANVPFAPKSINEWAALAKGSHLVCPDVNVVLDIGGQDTKIICHENGDLKRFYINDRCAAGSGMFLINTLRLLEMNFDDLDLEDIRSEITLSSACAVFAQTEIVGLIADNVPAKDIAGAVVWHILLQSRSLLSKVNIENGILLSGGLTQIRGFQEMAGRIFETQCTVGPYAGYLSAIGCALSAK